MLAQVQKCNEAIKSWHYTIHGCVSGMTTPGHFEYWHQVLSTSATAVPIATGICMLSGVSRFQRHGTLTMRLEVNRRRKGEFVVVCQRK